MHYGRTQVVICEDEFDLGQRASSAVAQQMRNMLDREQEIRMILAAGESQITFLDALSNERDIEWSRVVCFNMDEFWDLPTSQSNTPAAIRYVPSYITKFGPKAITLRGSTPRNHTWKHNALRMLCGRLVRSTYCAKGSGPPAI